MTDLARKRERHQLMPRREPYWQRIGAAAYLGFRRGPDSWVVRLRSKDHKQQYKALGAGIEFDDAKRAAEDWIAQLSGAPVRSVKRDTVIAALNAYLADLRRHDRTDAAKTAEGRFKTALAFDNRTRQFQDPLAALLLEQTTQDDFLEWRDRLRAGRLPRTVNRLVRAVCAGLNRANRLGHVGNSAAWRVVPLPDDDESETAVFLTAAQRSALIAAASQEAAAFMRGLSSPEPGQKSLRRQPLPISMANYSSFPIARDAPLSCGPGTSCSTRAASPFSDRRPRGSSGPNYSLRKAESSRGAGICGRRPSGWRSLLIIRKLTRPLAFPQALRRTVSVTHE